MVRAAWSPGAVTGQLSSAGWPRRDPVSRVVLVVAVVLRGAGRGLTRLGRGVVSVEGPRLSVFSLESSQSQWIPSAQEETKSLRLR